METNTQQKDNAIPDPGYARRVTERYMLGLGEDIEALMECLRWLPGRQPYVYQIQLRAPMRDQQDWLMLIKGVGEEGPVIAFHSGRTPAECMLTYPPRMRAGKLTWREDEYTPDKYPEIAEHIQNHIRHMEATQPRLPGSL